MNSAASAAHAINFNVGNAEVEFDGIVGGADNGDLGAIGITGNLDLDANIVGAASLAVSGTSNLGANVTTSGNQTYTGDITLSADVGLNTSGGDVQIDGDVNTALVSGGSESGIIQFLGNGSYQYSADGGSIYTTATATSSATTLGTGSLTYSGGSYSWTTPSGVTSTKLLVVGGGGGGGSSANGDNTGSSGGGGAGGLIYDSSYSLNENTNYEVTVGGGGSGGASNPSNGIQGENSVFNDQTAIGGGYGAKGNDSGASGGSGGSGGGGGNDGSGTNGGSGTVGQGNDGGSVSGNNGDVGAGGGGAGEVGESVSTSSNTSGGDGGDGIASNITGSSVNYSGGGGGGANLAGNVNGTGGSGGLGGGGNGGNNDGNGSNGTANSGGGGGGGADNGGDGGDGGSGIVVVNYSYNSATYAEYDLSINTGAGDIDVNGALANLGELNLTSTSAGSEISGIISTDTIVNKAGVGSLTLSSNNTYTGLTNIDVGTIIATHANALGATSAGTVVDSGAALAVSGGLTVAEPVSLSGTGVASAGALSLISGNNTYSGAITLAADTLIKSTAGTPTLSATINGGYALTTVASDALTVSGVIGGTTPLTKVNLSTTSGNLTLGNNIAVAGTGTDAMIFNAGSSTAAGTTTGGNIILSGSPTLTTGDGGRITFYTGSVSGSTGLTSLIGSGTHRFRYNSDETTTNYTATLSSGSYAIYREQPTLTVTAENEALTYGTTPTPTVTISGMQNGDANGTVVTTAASISIGGATSTSGNYTAGSHTITPSAAASTYGYGFDYDAGTLTVAQYDLTATIATVSATYGAGVDAGSVSLNQIGDDVVGVTASIVSPVYSNASKLKAGSYSQITGVTANLTGADAANYTLSATTRANSVSVAPKAITYDIAAGNITYGAADSAGSISYSALETGDVVSASAQIDDRALSTAGKLEAGTYTQSINGSHAGVDKDNYTITLGTANNYVVGKQAITYDIAAGNITYGAADSAGSISYSALETGDVVSASAQIDDRALSTAGKLEAGTYAQSINGSHAGVDKDNYTITLGTANNYVVGKQAITYDIAAGNITYGAADSAGSISYSALETGDVVSASAQIDDRALSTAGKLEAGTYAQSINGSHAGVDKDNYTITLGTANNYVVGKQAITYDIAAGNITYGAADSAGSISYSALETGDVVSASAQIDDRALSTAGKLEAGTYAQSINGSHAGVDKDNYTITLGTANSYVVGKQAITYDIAAGNITYGAADSAGSISYSALETGDVVSASAQIDDRALSTAGKLEAGTYAQSINGSHAGVDKDNYTITLGTANNYVVGKQAITYDIAAGNITYGAADSAGSISYSALETGDVVSASAQIDDRALSTAGKLEAGTYAQSINGSHAGVDKDNYTITLGTANNYVVGKQAITYDIAAGNITYGAADSAGSISYSALETGDVVSASAQIDDRALSTAGKLEAGTYAQSINGSHAGVDKDNYTITLGTANNYVVGKQAITYDIAAGNITYGAADSAGSISYSALETGDVVSASAQIDDRALSTAGKLEAGTYAQSINGSHAGVDKDNYTITLGTANNYVVGKQAITYDIAAGNITYGAADSAGSISYSALETGDVVSASAQIDDRALSTAGKLEAGTYAQSINGSHAGVDKDNYTITLGTANNYVVGKQAITYDIAAGNITYGAADSAGSISYSALETGDVVSASAQIDDRALSTAGKLEAGTYAQSINGSHAGVDKDNYTITLGTANNYVVGKQAITYDIAAGNITYGAADSAGSISYSALETGDVVSASAQIDDRALSTAGKLEAGTYAQSINGSHAGVDKDNYTITLGTANNYVVGKQAITYDIAAGNITYGAADSAGSISYSALETGDVVSASAQIDDRALSTAGKLEAGTYAQSINGSHAGVDKDNYTITLGTANNYVVGKQAITYDIAAGNITYGAADSAGSISYSALETGDVVSASAQIDDRALSTAGKLEAGTYAQSINGSHAGVDKDNYTITLGTANNYVVGKQAITYDIAAGNITYGAADSAGSISYSALETGDVVSASAQIDDRALSTAGKLEAGTYAQSINGSHAGVDKDNYTITLGTANSYVVGKQAITYDIAAGNITYGAADSAGSISYSALETGDVVSASAQIDDRALSTAGKLEAGTYAQSINGSHAGVDKDNYTITLGTANNYVVGKQAITYDIAAGNITYGAADSAGSISYSALETGDVVSASAQIDDRALSTAGKLEAGTYAQSINGSHAGVDKDNYTITLGTANNYVVGKQAITYDIAAGNITYGAADSAGSISYSALETGDVVSASAQIDDRALSTAGKLEAGTYAQSINGSHAGVDKDNYTITLGTANNYVVGKQAITYDIAAGNITYGAADSAGSISYSALETGDVVSASAQIDDRALSTAGKLEAGTYAQSINGSHAGVDKDNYTITLGTANNYVVGKQAITYDIAAGNITYGAADSAGSISYSALETGDVVSASAQIDDRALSTAGKLEAGTYAQSINGSHAGVDKDNYTITLGTANNYVVGKQAITYDIAAGNITYGAADSAGSISYSALETGDVVSASAQIDDRALSTAGKLEAGTYAQSINGSHAGVDKDNYTITLGTANNYVVGKQAITYDIAAGNITYGAADSAGSISYSALETGDVVSASAQIDDRALSTAGKLEAGTYAQSINGSHAGVDKDNYTITLGTANNYVVGKQAITVTNISASNKEYNGNTEATIDVSLASFSGLVDDDTVTVSATGTFSDKNVDTGKIVTLSETYAGTDRNNYTITSQGSTTANITAAPLTYSVAANDKTYDGDTEATATLTLAGYINTETLTETNSSTFDTKNVGSNKTVTVNSITLADGTNGGLASNYSISTGGTTTANITQLASVTWTGSAGDGLWSSATNWAGSAIPDLDNVAQAIIPEGVSITFDTDSVTTNSDGSIGSSIVNAGTLTFSGASDYTFDQQISGAGDLVKANNNTLSLSGTNTYTGDTTISAGTLKLTGNLNSATNLVIAPSATLDLQAALTAATLDLDGTISNTAGTSSLIISGTV